MAEQYPSSELLPSNITPLYAEDAPAPEEDNMVYVNSLPDINRIKALRRMGEITMAITLVDAGANGAIREITPGYGEILSSEPMRMAEDIKSGIIEVDFLQYWSGFRGDNYGTPHMGYKRPGDNNRSLETVRVLTLRWTPHWKPEEETVEGFYLHPRNHKYKLLDYRSRLRRKDGREEIETIRTALWGPDD